MKFWFEVLPLEHEETDNFTELMLEQLFDIIEVFPFLKQNNTNHGFRSPFFPLIPVLSNQRVGQFRFIG